MVKSNNIKLKNDFFKIANTYKIMPQKRGGNWISTKCEVEKHGWELKSAKYVAEKYEDYLRTEI